MAQIIHLPIAQREKTISVIMVSYMTGPALSEAIHAVMQDPDIYELILVDNGNAVAARQSLAQVAAAYERVRIMQGQGNIGFARGCNYGASLAQGECFLFLNPDALISNGAARALEKCGQSLSRPWVAGGMLRDVNGQEQRGGRRGRLTLLFCFLSFTPLA